MLRNSRRLARYVKTIPIGVTVPAHLDTAEIARRIDILRLFACVLVVWIHSANLGYQFTTTGLLPSGGAVLTVESFVAHGLATIATPLFAVISGYLLFKYSIQGAWTNWYPRVLLKRMRTIVLPYVIWSGFSLAILFLVMLAFGDASVSEHLREKVASPAAALRTLLVDPLPYQLWYLRNLLFLAVLSPFISLALRRLGLLVPATAFFLWMAGVVPAAIRGDFLAFYLLGAFIAAKNVELSWKPRLPANIAAWVAWVGLTALAVAQANSVERFENLALRVAEVAGVLAIWWNFDALPARLQRNLASLSYLSFFIFLAHQPLLAAVHKMLFTFVFSAAPASRLIEFFSAPTVDILLVGVGGYALNRWSPGLFEFLTGGRGRVPRGTNPPIPPLDVSGSQASTETRAAAAVPDGGQRGAGREGTVT